MKKNKICLNKSKKLNKQSIIQKKYKNSME